MIASGSLSTPDVGSWPGPYNAIPITLSMPSMCGMPCLSACHVCHVRRFLSWPGAYDVGLDRACDVVCERMPDAMREAHAYVGEALKLEETIRERMACLPPEIFEQLLHSVFKEDEWKLVAVGGALGAALGVAQNAVFHAAGLG